MTDLINLFTSLYQRLTWLSILDLTLVTLIFFGLLLVVRDTQAMVIMRGVILLVIVMGLLTSVVNLPAFTWLIQTTLPALFLVVPVIFAPELRRGLERLGRAGSGAPFWLRHTSAEARQQTVKSIVTAAVRLAARKHGALIVLERNDDLREYIRTGVRMDAGVTPELLLQIFYPNTPLHDGAAIITDHHIAAAACVMPLSASGILNRSPDRQMGLRHRAALGISEASDAIAVVVSEETGTMAIAQAGRMLRRLDAERLENILLAFYKPSSQSVNWLKEFLQKSPSRKQES
jgi:diadenylate cyclase